MRSVSVMTSLRLSPGMKWTVFLPMKCTVLQISTVKFSGQFKAVMDFLPYCINAAKLIIVNILQFNGLRFGFSRKLQSSVMGTFFKNDLFPSVSIQRRVFSLKG